jgi:OmcA/MtrC family decaheme c-type cytochrome
VTFGNADEYDSYANVEGCEKCHGSPYMKHGYRAAAVNGLPTFSACKACHMDDRAGGHEDWQQIVDDPVAWGNGDSAKLPKYAYTRRIMNDVHMSHAMEFPYPMSMSNCSTCHEGQIDKITADKFFNAETCKSCHGIQARPPEYDNGDEPGGLAFYEKRAPSMETIWENRGVGFHDIEAQANCSSCHAGGFPEFHNGYDSQIYDADGNRYADLYQADITSLSMTDGLLDIKFTSNTDLMTAPQVYVSFYGYGAKQFLVASHTRDDNNQRMEYTIGSDHPLFSEEADSAQGNWHVVLDTTAYASDPTLAEMIEDGKIERLEVSIRPTVQVGGMTVATNAVSKTLELASNTIDDDYFKGANAVVDVAGCNACHDALGTTFHSPDRGGDITMCKHCHEPSSGGSHLEMQSREIASYAHAIHSFQPFDTDEVDFTDKVEAKLYGLHIEHVFPNFTIKNCEACHTEGVFDVPDQTESLSAVTSASWEGIVWADGHPRNIGNVPSYVIGPASKACGSCHRAEYIKEDRPGDLGSFNQHTKAGGYLVEAATMPWDAVVADIMELFGQ